MAGAGSAKPRCSLKGEPFRSRTTCDPIRKPTHALAVGLELKEVILGSHRLVPQSPCFSSGLSVTTLVSGRSLRSPVRFTLAATLGSGLDGAWWPHTPSIARELSDLTGALGEPLGEIIDIGVNWSPLQGVSNLDLINHRGVAATPGEGSRHFRVITVTGSRARADLLVVPSGTSIALATMLLRQAADLPVVYAHQRTTAFASAGAIVKAARAQRSLAPPVSGV